MDASSPKARTWTGRQRALQLLLAFSLLITACGRPLDGVSVLVISADSLRVDRLPLWNPDGTPQTPHLDELAARGTVYRNAWATSPWTAPSMVSLFTGLYPPSHGVAYRDDTTPPSLPTLSRLLAERGYRLGNFSFFSNISYFRNLGLGEVVKGIGHRRVAGGFDRWLAEVPAEQPFFAWVHLLEPHLPYGASGYRATRAEVPGSTGLVESQLSATVPWGEVEFESGDRGELLRLYDRDVAEMDRVLGRVLGSIESRGRTASTLVIFVADHGEELLDEDWVGHASTAIRAKMLPEILRIPLVLAGPGIPAGGVEDGLVQQVDVLPTVAGLLDLELPGELDGRPLPGVPLPGVAWPWRRTERELAFFDSSPGGNLTPQDLRGERLQAVTDGTECLLAVHTYQGRKAEETSYVLAAGATTPHRPTRRPVCDEARRASLLASLERWREEQTQQRLAVLAENPAGMAPDSAEVDAYAERLEIVEPRTGETVSWEASGGQIALAWTAPRPAEAGEVYWVEYRLGDLLRTSGSFQVEQRRVVFGPIPQGFWNDVARYSPIRIRLVDAVHKERSPWIEYDVLPTG